MIQQRVDHMQDAKKVSDNHVETLHFWVIQVDNQVKQVSEVNNLYKLTEVKRSSLLSAVNLKSKVWCAGNSVLNSSHFVDLEHWKHAFNQKIFENHLRRSTNAGLCYRRGHKRPSLDAANNSPGHSKNVTWEIRIKVTKNHNLNLICPNWLWNQTQTDLLSKAPTHRVS